MKWPDLIWLFLLLCSAYARILAFISEPSSTAQLRTTVHMNKQRLQLIVLDGPGEQDGRNLVVHHFPLSRLAISQGPTREDDLVSLTLEDTLTALTINLGCTKWQASKIEQVKLKDSLTRRSFRANHASTETRSPLNQSSNDTGSDSETAASNEAVQDAIGRVTFFESSNDSDALLSLVVPEGSFEGSIAELEPRGIVVTEPRASMVDGIVGRSTFEGQNSSNNGAPVVEEAGQLVVNAMEETVIEQIEESPAPEEVGGPEVVEDPAPVQVQSIEVPDAEPEQVNPRQSSLVNSIEIANLSPDEPDLELQDTDDPEMQSPNRDRILTTARMVLGLSLRSDENSDGEQVGPALDSTSSSSSAEREGEQVPTELEIPTELADEEAASLFIELEPRAEPVFDPLIETILSNPMSKVEFDIRPQSMRQGPLEDLEIGPNGDLIIQSGDRLLNTGSWVSVKASRLALEADSLHSEIALPLSQDDILERVKVWRRAEGEIFAPVILEDSNAIYHVMGAADEKLSLFPGVQSAHDNLSECSNPPTLRGILEWNNSAKAALILKHDASKQAQIGAMQSFIRWAEDESKIDYFSDTRIGNYHDNKSTVILSRPSLIREEQVLDLDGVDTLIQAYHEAIYDQVLSLVLTRHGSPSSIYLSTGQGVDARIAIAAVVSSYRKFGALLGEDCNVVVILSE